MDVWSQNEPALRDFFFSMLNIIYIIMYYSVSAEHTIN